MAPLPQFIEHDVPRPTKRRRVEMPSVADGFTADNTNAPRRQIARPRVALPVPKPQNLHVHPVPKLPTSNPKSQTPLKQVHLPSFSLPNTKPLHPAPPPPPPVYSTPLTSKSSSEQDKDLKTISTTSIGLLNALSSSNGGEDLAAFLLPHRDQSAAPSLVTPTSRGIELSPEKRGKGHSPKFIRGGLAARASALFNRAHTSLVLWQKETERRARSGNTLPDLTATIVKILHLPRPNSKPSPLIALCRIHHQSDSYAPDQLYKVIFSLPQLSLDRLKQGLTIRIFHPWHELSLTHPPSPVTSNADSNSLLHSRRPASLPLPVSLPSTPDLPINSTTALFCSRLIF